MAYVVQGGKETLLGQRDSVALEIINLDLQGYKPDGPNTKKSFPTQATEDPCENVSRMEMLNKQDPALDKMEEKQLDKLQLLEERKKGKHSNSGQGYQSSKKLFSVNLCANSKPCPKV